MGVFLEKRASKPVDEDEQMKKALHYNSFSSTRTELLRATAGLNRTRGLKRSGGTSDSSYSDYRVPYSTPIFRY